MTSVALDRAATATLAFVRDLVRGYHPRDFEVRLWDGSVLPAETEPRFALVLTHPGALRAMLWPPSERTLGEAYLRGDVEVEGELEAAFRLGDHLLVGGAPVRARQLLRLLSLPSAERTSAFAAPADLAGHYDLPAAFFALFLDARMQYTCAAFASHDEDLDAAQERKLDLVCRKLGLRTGERLLDVGCGWGGLLLHATERYGTLARGVTLSTAQAEQARSLGAQVDVADFFELDGAAEYEAIASVGMLEHVPAARQDAFFRQARQLLRPGGRLLVQAIARPAHQPPRRGASFLRTYVFPGAELVPISDALAAAERAGFEVRDVESLRESYVLTTRAWRTRLEARREEAAAIAGDAAVRLFRLYLAGSAHGFSTGRVSVFQSLLVAREDA
ncbi:MAG TPA: cyclopropane-fatty-acyl-phospholipid synthase family protein [Gaiellaceae bacterium]|nr:cyclopropane-fatty-acyl-phospholipid synthase family protein [Gaiellaceae bacterium]